MRHFASKKLNYRGFAFWKKSTFEPTNENFRNFYDGLYTGPIYQNMHLKEKNFAEPERKLVVVFEGVGGLEVKDSVPTLDREKT